MLELRRRISRFIEGLPRPELFRVGAIITLLVLFVIVLGVFWMPYEPTAMSTARLQGISAEHLLGTDKMGRDILSRVMYGSRITLLVALGTMVIGAGLGILIGAITGFYGGVVDEVVMRIMDVLFAFPNVLLALVFVSLFGSGTFHVMWALGIAFIPSFARVVRSEVIRCKHLDYVKNARLQGVGDMRVIFVHILPNIRGVLISNLLNGFNNAVLAEAGLSFLGIGSQPPYASLGQMISEAQEIFFRVPTSVLGPGLMIVLMVLGFSLMGEGIRSTTQGLEK
ncbi:MAG: ABC transporter permease [Atopobiaceae bacterium]|nr:ABC transporter permease [Atopobiaceae bacterium]